VVAAVFIWSFVPCLAPLASTVPRILQVTGENLPTAGTAKGNRLHDLFPGLANFLPERKAQKEENRSAMSTLTVFYSAENAGKDPDGFGRKVKWWV